MQQATQLIANLTIEEKVSLATGVGWAKGVCVGNTPAIPSINFPGLCLQDSPTGMFLNDYRSWEKQKLPSGRRNDIEIGVRFTDFASAFPAAINVAATWDRNLTFQRSAAMGAEFRGKGVNVALSPMQNMVSLFCKVVCLIFSLVTGKSSSGGKKLGGFWS
jgi:beta-glucosidase